MWHSDRQTNSAILRVSFGDMHSTGRFVHCECHISNLHEIWIGSFYGSPISNESKAQDKQMQRRVVTLDSASDEGLQIFIKSLPCNTSVACVHACIYVAVLFVLGSWIMSSCGQLWWELKSTAIKRECSEMLWYWPASQCSPVKAGKQVHLYDLFGRSWHVPPPLHGSL